MATITLAQVQEDIARVRSAINDVIEKGHGFGLNGRRVDKSSLEALQKHLDYLEAKEIRLSRGGIKWVRGVARR